MFISFGGFLFCGFVFILLVGLGFLGDDAGREAIQHQHLFAKSRVKLKLSKEKLIYLGEKTVISQCLGGKKKKAVMTDREVNICFICLGTSCNKGPSAFPKLWQYVHSVFLSHSMQTTNFS